MKPYAKPQLQDVRRNSSEDRTEVSAGASGHPRTDEYKSQFEGANKKVSTLEATLSSRETEINKLKLDLASCQSALEKAQNELKVKTNEGSRRENEQGKLELDLQNKANKVCLQFYKNVSFSKYFEFF